MSAGGGREEGAAAAAMLQLLREQPEPQAEESGAQRFALCLPPGEEEVKEVEETIEEMLIRLDEFCGMTDVIRSDTSQILDETIPLIKAKVVEMNNIYAKVDKLEKHTPSAQHTYDLPKLYRTEDYFPTNYSTGMPIIKRHYRYLFWVLEIKGSVPPPFSFFQEKRISFFLRTKELSEAKSLFQ
ncbi:breast carcinoma-amplified sequence 4 isoform X5 [Chelonia mydas]|uniref:breast carcinoma-amplified sequence 4 isoform X5 n=1 Tax=Chelonia mydas TaxID=8469 RepID=UPI001CA7E145|nr:breast carcinoma-amplified sequence 4 isoform X5 [Chelonia mydas]